MKMKMNEVAKNCREFVAIFYPLLCGLLLLVMGGLLNVPS